MNKYILPTELEISGVMCPIKSDYRDILQLFNILDEPNLLDSEKYIAKVLELIKPNMSDDELDSLLPWNISKLYNLS